jgi:hypothetical protein
MNFSFVHEFDIDPQGFWDLFFSEPYEEDLYKRLRMRSRTVLERKDEGNILKRTQRMEPPMNIPSWASSVVKETGYTEYDVLDKKASRMEVRIEPAMMKDRFHITSWFQVTPAGPGRCRREYAGEIKISVPLLGGKLEKLMVDQLREAYDTAAQVTREWVAKKKAQPTT